MTKPIGLTAVIERLLRNESPADILASLRRPGEHELLRRVAVVRAFDRRLYDELLADDNGKETPSFADFVQLPEVELLPRTEGVYQLRADARSTNWKAWWSDDADTTVVPAQLARLLQRLADHYRKSERPVDLLAQLALVDHDEALALFGDLYRETDERFDLAGCQDLIDVLSEPERAPLLGSRLTAARNDRASYLRARSLWSAEHYQSETFFEPEGVLTVYEELLGGKSERVLNLHGPGGSGKTIQLRWLIARQLVPEHKRKRGHPFGNGRIACARLDFDFVHPVNATKYPWLVLIEAAAQLNHQLPKAPFNELLDTYGWAIPLLRRDAGDPTRVEAASKRMASEGAQVDERVRRRFSRSLNEAAGKAPVLLVLDTLEEVHLRPQGDLVALLELLRELMDECRGVRLILSGRYSVAPILGPAAASIGPMREAEVRPLTDEEAHRYLEERRGLEKQAVRAAVVEKAKDPALAGPNARPYVLALLADLVQARPNLSAAEISRYPADVIFLIRRVVSRIEEPGVRWILRYGVVPRSLTFEFVQEVMQPFLRASMAGKRRYDTPRKDPVPVEAAKGENFQTDVIASPEATLDLAELWTQLRRYAGSTSWVSEVPGEEQAVRFRSDVVVPMRQILRSQRVFRRLHRAAAAYFEAKAADERELWERWTREALFHRFQHEGAKAARYWRRALDAADDENPAMRAVVAGELLEPDYVDEEGRPLPFDADRPLVTPETLIEAHFEVGSANADFARTRLLARDAPVWATAEQSLAAVKRRQAELGKQVVPPARLARLEAELHLKNGLAAEAAVVVRRALGTATDRADVARLWALLGDAQLAQRDEAAPASYERARKTAARLRTRTLTAEFDAHLVRALSELDRFAEAYEAYRRALPTAASPSRKARLHMLGARIGLGTGHYAWAEKTAASSIDLGGPWDAWKPRVSAARLRLEPRRARDLVAKAEEAAGTATVGAVLDPSRQTALGRQLAGMCAGDVMQFDAAFSALETARSLWQSMGDAEGVAASCVRTAFYKLRGAGDVKAAEHNLREARDLNLPSSSETWLEVQLLHAEQLRHLGAEDDAAAVVASVIDTLSAARGRARSLVRAAVAGLAGADPAARIRSLDLLLEHCERVTPPSARIVLVRELRRVQGTPGERERERLQRLRKALSIGGAGRLTPADRGLLHLTLVELERLVGNTGGALKRLAIAREQLGSSSGSYFLREWWLAVDRVGRVPSGASASRDAEAFCDELEEFSLLCAAFLLERLEAMPVSSRRSMPHLLRRAEQFLGETPDYETQWHARLLEAKARLDERSEHSRSAGYLGAAAAVYSALGDTASAARTSRGARDEPLAELEAGRARVILSDHPDGIEVRSFVPPAVTAVPDPRARRLVRELRDWARKPGPHRSPVHLEDRWIRDRVKAGVELGSLVLPPAALEALRSSPSTLDLRIEAESGGLDFLPWELARTREQAFVALEPGIRALSRAQSKHAVAREEIRFLQVALNRLGGDLLIDTDFGPASEERLRRYESQRGLRSDGLVDDEVLAALQQDLARADAGARAQPLVVLVQPSEHRQLEGLRGKLSVGVDLGRLYESSGFEVWRVENPSVDEIHRAIGAAVSESRPPAVLHLAGGLREVSHGVALTFLSGEWHSEYLGGSRFSDELPVTAVDYLLAAFPPDSFRPLLILDIDRPPGITETIGHLFLRNAFAGALFRLGRCPAVLATGLVDEVGTILYASLVQTLASGATVAEAASTVRSSAAHVYYEDELSLALVGTALFTHLPWLRPAAR